jgi:hypothetical protein
MVNIGVARLAPRNARSCRGSASFSKPSGVPRGHAPLVAGHREVSEKGRQRSVGRGNAKRFPLQGPHGGMGAARTDGEHAVTGPLATIL